MVSIRPVSASVATPEPAPSLVVMDWSSAVMVPAAASSWRLATRVADTGDRVADVGAVLVEGDGVEAGGAVELDQRHVGLLVEADHGGVVRRTGRGDGGLERGGVLDHVVVRERQARGVQHHRGAGAGPVGQRALDEQDALGLSLGGRGAGGRGVGAGLGAEATGPVGAAQPAGVTGAVRAAGQRVGRLPGSSPLPAEGEDDAALVALVGQLERDRDRDRGGDHAARDAAGDAPAPPGAAVARCRGGGYVVRRGTVVRGLG